MHTYKNKHTHPYAGTHTHPPTQIMYIIIILSALVIIVGPNSYICLGFSLCRCQKSNITTVCLCASVCVCVRVCVYQIGGVVYF